MDVACPPTHGSVIRAGIRGDLWAGLGFQGGGTCNGEGQVKSGGG